MNLREYISMIEEHGGGLLGRVKLRLYRMMLLGFTITADKLDALEQDIGDRLSHEAERVTVAERHLEQIDRELHDLRDREKLLTRCLYKMQADLGATARQTMLAKWCVTDSLLPMHEKPSDILTCKICGCSHQRAEYEVKTAKCIFNGGALVRYVCPDCGVIFGPTKFTAQGQDGIDEDYWVHYLGFSEGDSSYKEERAFFMLKPEKDKVYLNYGCGKWTKSLQALREMGYIVYGYEPYATEIDNPYLIRRYEDLKLLRFDGIYSNDVLEHFIDPIKDMAFMATLLKDDSSRMAHCTSCYTYKYEYTRFHTHFFLGDSVKILAERSGLRIVDCCNDIEENDFFCYVYGLPEGTKKNCEVSLLEHMIPYYEASFAKGQAVIGKNGVLCGPYMFLLQGKYRLCINIVSEAADVVLQVTARKGQQCLCEQKLCSGENTISLSMAECRQEVEFVIRNFAADITVDCMALIYEESSRI